MKKEYRYFFIAMIIVVIATGLISLSGPLCIEIWNKKGETLSAKGLAFVIGLMVLANILNIILIVYRERFAQKYNEHNFKKYIELLLNTKYDYLIEEGPSNLLEKIVNSVNGIYTYMTDAFIHMWSSILVAAGCIILIANANIWIAIMLLLVIPIDYLGFKILNNQLSKKSQIMQKMTGEGFQEIMSDIQQPDYMKQLSDYTPLLEKMSVSVAKIYRSMARVNEYAQSMSTAISGISSIIQNIVMLIMVYLFYCGEITPYLLMISTIAVPMYFSSVNTIVNTNISKRDYNIAKDLFHKLEENSDISGFESVDNISSIDVDISNLIIKNKSIPFKGKTELEKGDILQVCGPSGCGKSSFAKGIIKFREMKGVKINGFELEKISNKSIRDRIEYVSQNIPIIKGSLRENLLFGKKRDVVSDSELLSLEFMKSIYADKKLDDVILENGANLSGGEKQKIAIARALISNPDVLILDEVCSNIDAKVSNEIYSLIAAERCKRITILITHDKLPDGLVNKMINC